MSHTHEIKVPEKSPRKVGVVESDARNKTLQMWVSDPGVKCEDPNIRDDQCALVAEQVRPNALTQFTIDANARDIVRAFLDIPLNNRNDDDTDTCDANVENNVVFQFFIVESNSVVSNVATWSDTQIDLVGPDAPVDVTAGIGEEKLIIEWENREAFVAYRQSDTGRKMVDGAVDLHPQIEFYEVIAAYD